MPDRTRAGPCLAEAYALDSNYRASHHGKDVMPPGGAGLSATTFTIAQPADSLLVFEENGMRIVAFRADHGSVSAAVRYRIDYAGRSIVVSWRHR
jgi:ribonuclease Z